MDKETKKALQDLKDSLISRLKITEAANTNLQDLVKERLPDMIAKEVQVKEFLSIMHEIGLRIESINIPILDIEKKYKAFSEKYADVHARKGPGPDMNALEHAVETIRDLKEDYFKVKSAVTDIKASMTKLNEKLRKMTEG